MEIFAKVTWVGKIDTLDAREYNGQHYDAQDKRDIVLRTWETRSSAQSGTYLAQQEYVVSVFGQVAHNFDNALGCFLFASLSFSKSLSNKDGQGERVFQNGRLGRYSFVNDLSSL